MSERRDPVDRILSAYEFAVEVAARAVYGRKQTKVSGLRACAHVRACCSACMFKRLTVTGGPIESEHTRCMALVSPGAMDGGGYQVESVKE